MVLFFQTTIMPLNQTTGTIPYQIDEINPVVWAYLICGGILILIAFFFFALFLWKLETRVRNSRGTIVEDREEDSIKGLVYLFILICIYYFFCVAGETSYNSYIYSISICSDLNFSVSLCKISHLMYFIFCFQIIKVYLVVISVWLIGIRSEHGFGARYLTFFRIWSESGVV